MCILENEADQALNLSVPKILALQRFIGEHLGSEVAVDPLNGSRTIQTVNPQEWFLKSPEETECPTTWSLSLLYEKHAMATRNIQAIHLRGKYCLTANARILTRFKEIYLA
jgi:hypothetical protein